MGYLLRQKVSIFLNCITAGIMIPALVFSSIIIPLQRAYSQNLANLPLPGSRMSLSDAYKPMVMQGVNIYIDNPFEFDFIMDLGDGNYSEKFIKEESTKLIKYFLTSLTIPEDDLWVNLSPFERNRIIPEEFGQTEMGRDLLAQDYILKQVTASLMYPEDVLGKQFWQRVYRKTQKLFGTQELPFNTFNKVWIVPQKAVVYEHEKGAFLVESKLGVLLEEDYVLMSSIEGLSASPVTARGVVQNLQKNAAPGEFRGVIDEILRKVILPEIEKEVNYGKNFAPLRQICNSMILAAWYKKTFKKNMLAKIYVDQNKIQGVDVSDKQISEKIYNQYFKAFKKGVYDYIKKDYDPVSQDLISRKYFAGGTHLAYNGIMEIVSERGQGEDNSSNRIKVKTRLDKAAMSNSQETSTFSSIYQLGPVKRKLSAVLDDVQETNKFLEKIKIFLLFNLGAKGRLRQEEHSIRPKLEVLNDQELHVTFQTPLRKIEVFLNTKTQNVTVNIEIFWNALLKERAGAQHLSFNNVSLRKNEFLYNAWKNGLFLTGMIADWLETSIDHSDQFYDTKQIQYVSIENQRTQVASQQSFIQLTIPESFIQSPHGFQPSIYNPIYVLIENYREELGFVKEIVPASWDQGGLTILINGFQGKTSIREVFSFDQMKLLNWNMDFQPVIESAQFDANTFGMQTLELREDPFLSKVAGGPMIRGSSIAERVLRYKLGIPTAYTEMVLIGNLHIPDGKNVLGAYAHLGWLDGFQRLKISEIETDTVLQVVGPHLLDDEDMFQYQFEDENIVRTYIRAAHIAQKLGFSGFNINMCCPAAAYSQIYGGMGMLKRPELIKKIVEAVRREVPSMPVSAKVLLLSDDSNLKKPDLEKNIQMAKGLQRAGLSRLIIQAETSAFNKSYPEIVKELSHKVKIPITYNGGVFTIRELDKIKLLNEDKKGEHIEGYHSVEALVDLFKGTRVDQLMVARILLGSPWILTGETYSDKDILTLSIQQSSYMLGAYYGMANSGLISMKIGLLHYIKHIRWQRLREDIEKGIYHANSQAQIIQSLYEALSVLEGQGSKGSHSQKPPGGIDLSPGGFQIDFQHESFENIIQINNQEMNDIHIDGLVPIIMNMKAITNIFPIQGKVKN